MTPKQLKAIRKRLGMTQTALAEAIGYTMRQVGKYELGQAGIPRVVELAVEYLDLTRKRD